jgi:hypothetical protein
MLYTLNLFNSTYFSECESEWFDCIGEDETYIRDKENFYENCTSITNQSEVPIELLEVTKDKCFENRKCQADTDGDGEDLFVGGNSKCTCKELSISPNRADSTTSERYKRQTGEVFITTANVQRVFRARLGGTKLARDNQQLTRRKGNYSLIRRWFIAYTKSFEEEQIDNIK